MAPLFDADSVAWAIAKAVWLRNIELSIQLARSTQRLCFGMSPIACFLVNLIAKGFLGKFWVELPRRRIPQVCAAMVYLPLMSYILIESSSAQELSFDLTLTPPNHFVQVPEIEADWLITTTGRPVLVTVTVYSALLPSDASSVYVTGLEKSCEVTPDSCSAPSTVTLMPSGTLKVGTRLKS